MTVNPVPQGQAPVCAVLAFRDGKCAEAMTWYCDALGAEDRMRMDGPNGLIMHGEIAFGDSVIFTHDSIPEFQPPGHPGDPSHATLAVYIANVDQVIAKAESMGAKVLMPPQDMFWGDRYGAILDPWGHVWSIATHVEDVTPEQMMERMAAMQPG